MKLRTFYKKLAQVKNKFRWNFGIKNRSYFIRATPRSNNPVYCEFGDKCPIEAIFMESDTSKSAYFLGSNNGLENFIDIMHAADNDFDRLTYRQKRIRTRMLEILKGTS